MVSILRQDGLRFVIFTNDHVPAHVHAIKGSGEAKIDISTGVPVLVWADGLKRREIRIAMQIAEANCEVFLAEWSKIHG